LEMVEKLEGLVRSAVDAADAIRGFPGTVRVVSHYDADGIASAAIMVKALERERKEFRLSFTKQLSEEYIEGMKDDDEMLMVFTDLGSGFLKEIGKHLLGGGRKIIILDHHQVQGEVPEGARVWHVNPLLNGIEEDISGSGVSYLMARALSPINKDLSELAIIGAIGDSQTGSIGPHWGLLGINKEILKDAQSTGKISLGRGLRLWGRYGRPLHKALQYCMDPYIPGVSGSESGSVQLLNELGIEPKGPDGRWRTLASLNEKETQKLATGIIKERIRRGEDNPEWIFGDVYELPDKKESFRDANEFATMLNACGKSGNAWMGVGICLNDEAHSGELGKVMNRYRREIGKAVDLVRKDPGMVRVTGSADYVLAGSSISEHIISNVASIIEKSSLVPDGESRKPVFAMVDAEGGQTKVSGRASDGLVAEGINMKEIMSRAAEETGGQGGGHAGAGGAMIPAGSEERFINTVEKLLSERTAGKEAESSQKETVDNKTQATVSQAENEPSNTYNNIKEGNHNIEQAVASQSGGKEVEHGRKHEGTRTEGEGTGREEEGKGREEGRKAEEGRAAVSKEMERKGLVRYLFS
jgi:single-stranded-DNA-specific exonuclease